MKTIDLNCDLGEGFGAWEMGNDAAMIDLASSVTSPAASMPATPISCVGRSSWRKRAASRSARIPAIATCTVLAGTRSRA